MGVIYNLPYLLINEKWYDYNIFTTNYKWQVVISSQKGNLSCKFKLESIGFDDAQKISRLNAPGFNGLMTTWKAWKERKSKDDRGESAKNPPIIKLIFSRTQEFQFFRKWKTCLDLMWMNPYIESLWVVTCSVTFLIFVEVCKCKHNFHNGYRS